MPAVYTSATLRYLAKARVLAHSVKKHDPDTTVYLVLVDSVPDFLRAGIASRAEPFDVVLAPDELPIPDLRRWLFRHSVVEACTGVKGAALVHLLSERREDRVLYLDPDIVVFNTLKSLFAMLDDWSIALTPHCPVAEQELDPIVLNEISSLAHGVYNLGFIGVSGDAEGRRFAEWWQRRLYHFCQDDISRGLFTDQRWIDLVPAQFDRVRILRDAVYNAASWNMTQRTIGGTAPDRVLADGVPLCFYHFSGVNQGIPERMHKKFKLDNPVVADLVRWYRAECRQHGEEDFRKSTWAFDRYDGGQPITLAQRWLYRTDESLQQRFANPFAAGPGSYYEWLTKKDLGLQWVESQFAASQEAIRTSAALLQAIEQTLPYKIYTRFARLMRMPR